MLDLKKHIQRRPALSDQVYTALRDAVLSGQLPPNHRTTEREIGERLGVSRTPVREALGRLEQDGLVESLERSGFRILPISISDVLESYVCRAELEALAVSLAARRLGAEGFAEIHQCVVAAQRALTSDTLTEVLNWNSRFHHTVVKLSGNRRLAALYDVANVPIDRYRRLLLTLVKESPRATSEYLRFVKRSLQAHTQIAHSLSEGEHKQAARLMRDHVLATGQDLAAGLRIVDRERIVASGIILDSDELTLPASR
ncbi:MAG TPA: GntR family transcriptional regulator [bacterium]|jgi:DNA-binding GntR family transcriptional regulator